MYSVNLHFFSFFQLFILFFLLLHALCPDFLSFPLLSFIYFPLRQYYQFPWIISIGRYQLHNHQLHSCVWLSWYNHTPFNILLIKSLKSLRRIYFFSIFHFVFLNFLIIYSLRLSLHSSRSYSFSHPLISTLQLCTLKKFYEKKENKKEEIKEGKKISS